MELKPTAFPQPLFFVEFAVMITELRLYPFFTVKDAIFEKNVFLASLC